MSNKQYLVPNRSCGSCTACCKELAITDPALEKMPGVMCGNCTEGQGCSIYETRPSVCRDYHCLWRSLPNMDDNWRPDKSGVMFVPHDVPAGYPGPFAVNIVLIGSHDIVDHDHFAGMVAGFIDSGTATYLDLPGGPGMLGRNLLLNAGLFAAIAARDLPAVKKGLRAAYEALQSRAPEPVPEAFMVPPRT